MTEMTDSGRSTPNSSRPVALSMTRRGRVLAGVSAILVLVGTIGGYLYGQELARRDLTAAKALVDQLQPENQRLQRQIIDQNTTVLALQGKLASVQATLNAIMPAENIYIISPNQSMNVAGGHLTIGLVGPPTNESVNININGKQQSAATGDVIKVALDPSTACQVGVQSFDMFKAVLTASCAPVKP